MALQMGFSIREYASRMRSVDVANCWPFAEAAGEETVRSLLPPITVKKFTWWLDELGHIHPESTKINVGSSDKKKNNNNKKATDEKGETSAFRNEDVEEDMKAIKVKSLRGKMKSPKKRSIVDIFAVAPPVERGTSNSEEGEEDSVLANGSFDSHVEGIKIGLKGKMKEEKKKKKKKKKKMKNRDIILRKAKRVIKKIRKEKEQILDFKLQAQDKGIGNPSPSCSKEMGDDTGFSLSIPKRKRMLQHFDAHKRIMSGKAFNSIEERQYQTIPISGILKNRTEELPQDKHVTFSDKDDDTLTLTRKTSHPQECPKLHNGGGVGKDSTTVEASGSEDGTSMRLEKEGGSAGFASNDWFPVDSVTFTNQNNIEEEHSLAPERSRMYDDMNQHLSESGPHHNTPSAYHPGFFLTPLHEGYYCNSLNTEELMNLSNSTLIRRPNPCLKTCNGVSVSCLSDMDKSTKELPQASSQSSAHNGTVDNCWRRVNDMNGDFVGLPLNSQGELIGLNSSAKMDFNQMMNSSDNTVCFNSYVKENPHAVIMPSRFNIAKNQSAGKTILDSDFLQRSDHSNNDGEDGLQVNGNDKIQSKMRLMGKEFIVGERGFQRFDQGHIWKDNPTTDQLHFGNSSVNHRSESCALPHSDYRNNSMQQTVFVARKSDPVVQKLYPSLSPVTFSEVHNRESLFSDPFTSGYESRLFSPNLSTNSIQLEDKQNLRYYSPISAVGFPFMHPDLEGHPEWNQRSPMGETSLCFDASKRGRQLSNNGHSYCNQGHNHPYLMPGSHHGADSSMSFNPASFCLFDSLSSSQRSTAQTSLTPTLLTQHAVMPCYPGSLPVYAAQIRHANQKKIKQGIKSRVGVRGPDIGNRYKRQRSAPSNVPFNHFKMPAFGFHEGPTCAINGNPATFIRFEGSVQNIEGELGSCSATNVMRFGS